MAVITPVTVADFTAQTLEGDGVFDVIMRSAGAHVEREYNNDRIKGVEYATVYLGLLDTVLARSMQFLLEKDKVTLELELLNVQVELAELSKLKTQADITLVEAQVITAGADLLRIQAQTRLLDRQELNAVKEGIVLDAQACKLKAEFDVLMSQVPKAAAEIGLLNQKRLTEVAQTNGSGVTDHSVIGKQMVLYTRQADGFLRDAEQKVADPLIKTWSVRRTTDEATPGEGAGLSDANVKRAVEALLAGIQA